MAAPYTTKAGDRNTDMPITTDADFTGATGLGIRWRLRQGSAALVVGAGVLTLVSSDADGSVFSYAWAVSETDTAGEYEAEVFGTLTGKVQTVPSVGGFDFTITPILAAVP